MKEQPQPSLEDFNESIRLTKARILYFVNLQNPEYLHEAQAAARDRIKLEQDYLARLAYNSEHIDEFMAQAQKELGSLESRRQELIQQKASETRQVHARRAGVKVKPSKEAKLRRDLGDEKYELLLETFGSVEELEKLFK